MLSDFSERKETCFDNKKKEFFKVQKIPFSHAFGQKMTFFFSLVRYGQNKPRKNA